MKNNLVLRHQALCVAMLGSGLSGVWAASITNNDSGQTLTNNAARFGGVAPGPADIAGFDSNISAGTPGSATNALGGSTSWAGIQILNPAVPVQISADSTLANGLPGIDMSLATTNLTLSCPVVLGTNQSWLVTNGLTLFVNGVVSGARNLTIYGGNGTNGTIRVNAANTYAGGTLLKGGMVVVSNNATFGATAGGLINIDGTIRFGTGGGFTIANPLTFSNTTVLDGNISNAPNVNNTLSLPMSGNGTIIISNLLGVVTNDSSPVETFTFGASVAGWHADVDRTAKLYRQYHH